MKLIFLVLNSSAKFFKGTPCLFRAFRQSNIFKQEIFLKINLLKYFAKNLVKVIKILLKAFDMLCRNFSKRLRNQLRAIITRECIFAEY